MSLPLDSAKVRALFPAFSEPGLAGRAHARPIEALDSELR